MSPSFGGLSEDFKPTRQALDPFMHVAQLVWLGNRVVVSCRAQTGEIPKALAPGPWRQQRALQQLYL